jgi:hypothetical protein
MLHVAALDTLGQSRPAALCAALSQAGKEELIGKNVAMDVSLPQRRKGSRTRKAWTTDKARAFLESARSDGDRAQQHLAAARYLHHRIAAPS